MTALPALLLVACTASAPSAGPAPTPATLVALVAKDYSFDAPDTLKAGPVVFQLTNRGRMHHEVVIFAARPGVSARQLVNASPPETRRAMADPLVGLVFAPTHRPVSAQLQTTLEPNRWYILWCGIRDTVGMPLHYELGMIDSIYVR